MSPAPRLTALSLLVLSLPALAQVGDVNRAEEAHKVRIKAADFQRAQPLPAHPSNKDLSDFGRWATYSKGLPHDGFGEPDPTQYDKLLAALLAGDPALLEAVVLGGERKLVNPLSGYAFALEGADAHAVAVRPAPDFNNPEVSGEMEELYWMSLVRDVRFDQYASDATVAQAANRLSQARVYRGARELSGVVTPATVFRADTPGAVGGPFISQFLYKTVTYGGGPLATNLEQNPAPGVEPTALQPIDQLNLTRLAGDDRVTAYAEWLDIQNGKPPADPTDTLEDYDPVRRYIRNGRDLAEWVHLDYPIQASLNAALLIARQGDFLPSGRYDPDPKSSPRLEDVNSPYRTYRNQESFITFGNSEAQSVTALVTNTVLRAQWFQKWLVHRRLRPEEYGGRVHNTLTGARVYPVPGELLGSPVLPLVFSRNAQRNSERGMGYEGTYLLSQAFPEGSPIHPAYGSGHSTYMGAGITAIKAFYEDAKILNTQVPNPHGTLLVAYGDSLTMFDELDKLASNIGVARLFAGVHWRSDHDHAVRLGELYALRTLQDWTRLYRESFKGFQVRTLGGNTVTITPEKPALPNHVSAVNGFALIDALTGETIYPRIYNGDIISLGELEKLGHENVTIVAETYETQVGSVRFLYDSRSSGTVDNTFPYTVNGDGIIGVGVPLTLTVGTHVLNAVPFSGSNATVLGGVPLTIRFTVVN